MGENMVAKKFTLGHSVSLPSDASWQVLQMTRVGTGTRAYLPQILQACGQPVDDTVPLITAVEPVAVLISKRMWSSIMVRAKTKLPDKRLHAAWGQHFPGEIKDRIVQEIPEMSVPELLRLSSELGQLIIGHCKVIWIHS